MKTSIVLGAGFGDEGKGNVTNCLTKDIPYSLVVRFNGGHQAGHTVIYYENRHVFSSFGSGTLNGTPTFWSRYCTIYPPGFIREYDALTKLGIRPTMYVDPLCPITTPFDIDTGRYDELLNGHGSCGSGFGKTIWRHETLDHSYRIFAKDIDNEWILREKLKTLALLFPERNKFEFDIEAFIETCKVWRSRVHILSEYDVFQREYRANIVFEGAQGILLDREHGIFPHVTRSQTTSKNALEIIQRNGLTLPEIYYVSRCYQTRHGNGPLLGECSSEELGLINFESETNVENTWQGKFRYAPFSMQMLEYAKSSDKCYHNVAGIKTSLVITCLDQFDQYIPVLDDNGLPVKYSIDNFKRLFPFGTIFSHSLSLSI